MAATSDLDAILKATDTYQAELFNVAAKTEVEE